MGRKVFVSYSHAQREWVRTRLVPCLKAGGADVLIDWECFEAGKSLLGQMDRIQDRADVSVLVLSPTYFTSDNCKHEMDRALTRAAGSADGSVIPVKAVDCDLPERLLHSLYVDLTDESDSAWHLLLRACDADLGAGPLEWLRARDMVVEFLERNQSVNLVVKGAVKWRPLTDHIVKDFCPTLGVVDLDSGTTASREGLIAEILKKCDLPAAVARRPRDLEALDRIGGRDGVSRIALLHFDHIATRGYGADLLYALRFLVMQQRKLVLFIVSRVSFHTLLDQIAADQSSSRIDFMTIELEDQ